MTVGTLLLAGCTGSSGDTSASGTGATSAVDADPSAGVPAGLERFYGQQLAWTGCADYASSEEGRRVFESSTIECARLTVPLDYSDPGPDAPTLSLGVLRSPAVRADQRKGTALILPGSDGFGMAVAYHLASGWRTLGTQYDVVGFDRRGVGASGPVIECLTTAEVDQLRSTSARTRTDAEVAAANAEAAQFAPACVRNTATVPDIDPTSTLSHAGSREAAMDLDTLRAALGEQSTSVIGMNLGSQIALAYAAEHPERVDALVLDSPYVWPDAATYDIESARAAQSAFDQFASWCATDASCPLGRDPAAAQNRYRQLVLPLLDAPIPLRGDPTVSLTFDDAVIGTLTGLSSTAERVRLSVALQLLSGGTPDALRDLADQGWGRADGEYYYDASTAVWCVDGPRPPTGADNDRLALQLAEVAPFMDSGDPPRGLDNECSTWPVEPTFVPPALPSEWQPPTLVVGFDGNIYAPSSLTTALVSTLGAGLVTVNRVGNGALFNGGTCVTDVATDFLLNGIVPGDPIECP